MDADTKVKITFTQTRVVEDQHAGTKNETRFEAGKTYELSPRSGDRWVKRGVAKWASDEDAAIGAGASSDVALNLQDRDRVDPNAQNGPVEGTGTATDGKNDDEKGGADGAVDYEGMKGDELKALADERGVKAAGTKRPTTSRRSSAATSSTSPSPTAIGTPFMSTSSATMRKPTRLT